MKRFSDFVKENKVITGDKIKIDEILGTEIEVTGFKISDSKQKIGTKMLTLQFKLNGEERILFTGSGVLIDQVEEYKDEMPFLAKIEKVNRFYTFT